MGRLVCIGLWLWLLGGLAGNCLAGDENVDERVVVKKPREWREEAKRIGLTPDIVAVLEKQKLVLTSKCYEQVFVPYTNGEMPVFITSDSILNTFHVMFEDALVGNERRLARRMIDPLRRLFEDVQKTKMEISGSDELCERGKRRALITVGVAIRLLENRPVGADAALEKIIEEEAKRVIGATGQLKPDWLGKPDNGFAALDYSQFKPRGFYVKLPILQRYFRTIKWLQAIPFRIENDEELIALSFLLVSTEKNFYQPDTPLAFFSTFRAQFGKGDGPDLLSLKRRGQLGSPKTVAETRNVIKELFKDISISRINDLVTIENSKVDATTQPAARILSASWSVDAELFYRLAKRQSDPMKLPMGIAFASLMNSQFANSWIREQSAVSLLPIIESMAKEPKDYSVDPYFYEQYLSCLQLLFDEADPRLPALFRTNAWRQKSCHTFLASWAQMKHALQLHAKEPLTVANGAPHPVGFVEPYPEFFSQMSDLAILASKWFASIGEMDEQDMIDLYADRCQRLANELEATINSTDKNWQRTVHKLDNEAVEFNFWTLFFAVHKDNPAAGRRTRTKEDVKRLIPQIREVAAKIGSNQIPLALHREIVAGKHKFKQPDWASFAVLCVRLEGLARKQLAGEAFEKREDEFIRNYGISIAMCMGYESHRYLYPEDDAPRIVTVYTEAARGQKLHVGIGRPREMFLLYPAKGGDVLCRAAVLPYYEFPRSDRLTNQEWQALLDSSDPPRPPEWAKPLYAPNADKSTKLKSN